MKSLRMFAVLVLMMTAAAAFAHDTPAKDPADPAVVPAPRFVTVYFYSVKMDRFGEYMNLMTTRFLPVMAREVEAGKFPAWEAYRLMAGPGKGVNVIYVLPGASYADVSGVLNHGDALQKALGPERAARLSADLGATLNQVQTQILQYNPNLSHPGRRGYGPAQWLMVYTDYVKSGHEGDYMTMAEKKIQPALAQAGLHWIARTNGFGFMEGFTVTYAILLNQLGNADQMPDYGQALVKAYGPDEAARIMSDMGKYLYRFESRLYQHIPELSYSAFEKGSEE